MSVARLLFIPSFFNASKSTTYLLIAAMIAMVSACGGGGGSSDGGGSNNATLVINAGPDATVTEGASFALNAEVSGGNGEYTYSWSSSPALSIIHDDTSTASASFVAPAVTQNTAYTLTVSVNDTAGNTASDERVITVSPVNVAPVASISVPSWNGLETNTFPGGVEIILDGSASSDADAANTGSEIATYTWTQTAGTNVISGVATTLSTLTVTTPLVNATESLSFELVVTDTEGASDAASVTLVVQSQSETLPTADAGFSQAVFGGEVIVLEGSANTSIPSAQPLTYLWEQSGGVVANADPLILDSVMQVDDNDALSTFAIAPSVTQETTVTFTLSVRDANGNIVEDSIRVSVKPLPTPLINDTGVLRQATNTAVVAEGIQQNLWPGQDGQRGADVIEQNGYVEKAGRGKAGFDFTRLNQNGDEQDAATSAFSCVRDNVTGLIWEVKRDDGGLQDKDSTYSWYSDEVNGGFEGDINGTTTSCSLTNCNTQAYVEAINGQGLCGFFDWRMPTHQELFSIMHLGLTSGVAIDEDYFPNTGTISSTPIWYWTSVPSADGVNSDDAQNAWALDFESGVDNFLNKSTAGYVRLVRAGR